VVALLILTVPIVDTITVMAKRLIKGKSLFYADKNHFHHMLLGLGLSVESAVKVIILISASFSLLGIAGTVYRIPEYYLFSVFFGYFLLYFTSSFFIKN
jgi:UDP-GlcNAc:undecaprenyl-phosphate GlcNAc-1-phosphate transferase